RIVWEMAFPSISLAAASGRLSTSANGAARTRPGVLAPIEHNLAVDDDVLDPLAVLKRIFVRGPVDDALRVEQGQVGVASRPEDAEVENAELGRVETRHLAHGVLQPEQADLAYIDAQHPREGTEAARVRVSAVEGSING